jgi:ribosomal protein L40E
MSTSKSGQKRTILTEDGELRDESEQQVEPIFCTNCGTTNAPTASYCRKCGQSLLEQEADMMGVQNYSLPKAKIRAALAEQPAPKTGSSEAAVVLQIFTMLFVAGMAIPAFIERGMGGVGFAVIIAWFLVEAVRRTGRRIITAGTTVVDIFTMLFVTGMVIPATISGENSFPAIAILIGWVLIEAMRNYVRPH